MIRERGAPVTSRELLSSLGMATPVKLTKPETPFPLPKPLGRFAANHSSLSQTLPLATLPALSLGLMRRPNLFPLELLRPHLPPPLR